MPLVADVGGSEAFVDRMTELLAAVAGGWPQDAATERLRMVAIGHAMGYETWRSLTDFAQAPQHLPDDVLVVTGFAVDCRLTHAARPRMRFVFLG